MSYVSFDGTKPTVAGTRQVGIDAARNNGIALRDGIIIGRIGGWTLSVVNGSGTAEEPQYRVWSNGTERLRGTYTYTSGYVTAITWEYSADSGTTPNATGTWSTVVSETVTYTSTHQTAGANSSLLSWLYEWIGKFKDLRTLFTTHNGGAVGTYHSGVGTIASQAASAVAITGGTIKGTTIGGTGASEAALATYLNTQETYVPLAGTSGTINMDLSTGSWFRIAPSGGYTPTPTNWPTTGFTSSIILEISNGTGKALTLPAGASWGNAGAPTFSANTDYIQIISRDGGSTQRWIFGSKG